MTWNVKVTRDNVQNMELVANAMHRRLTQLLAQVSEYPLEVKFEGYRLFFETADDVTNFLRWLNTEVDNVKRAA